jgi:N-acyl-D-aspartate/D-glutamate deacylase
MADIVIRNGTIVDGSGAAPFEADVAVEAGRIVAVGRVAGRGVEEIDARGQIVTPGFIDPHSHYDAQVTWTSRITPSSWHGVTTTLIGNCGVGFAPCRPDQREMLVRLTEGVEDIPEPVLTEGLPWNWQSFPDYLDALEARPYDLDIATQVPHAAVRVFVMGQRGAEREPATEADAAAMGQIAAEGIRAGALGFSTSRTINHKTKAGELIPTLDAEEAELTAVARALRGIDAGWLQVISDFDDGGGVCDAAPADLGGGADDGDHHPAAGQQAGGVAADYRLDRGGTCGGRGDAGSGADAAYGDTAGV